MAGSSHVTIDALDAKQAGGRVRSLHVYPVKGARGITLDRAEILPTGIRHDRRFMLVRTADGRAITQREHARLALVRTSVAGSVLRLTAGAGRGDVLEIDLEDPAPAGERRCVRLFDVETEGVDVGSRAAAFFARHVAPEAALVFMTPDIVRPVEVDHAEPGDHVAFADGFPLLLASVASLDDLNRRLVESGATAVGMDRFRPNVVIEGPDAWLEDRAKTARIGDVVFRTPKRCARCRVTTVDQETAEVGKEPLRTLAKFRTEKNAVYFAVNAIPNVTWAAAPATIVVGDAITLGLS